MELRGGAHRHTGSVGAEYPMKEMDEGSFGGWRATLDWLLRLLEASAFTRARPRGASAAWLVWAAGSAEGGGGGGESSTQDHWLTVSAKVVARRMREAIMRLSVACKS